MATIFYQTEEAEDYKIIAVEYSVGDTMRLGIGSTQKDAVEDLEPTPVPSYIDPERAMDWALNEGLLTLEEYSYFEVMEEKIEGQ
jgi:hypothetical protein